MGNHHLPRVSSSDVVGMGPGAAASEPPVTKVTLEELPRVNRVWHVSLHGSSCRQGELGNKASLPTWETGLPSDCLLENTSSYGLREAESSLQKECGDPDQVPAQKCGCSDFWLQGVPEFAAATGGWLRYLLQSSRRRWRDLGASKSVSRRQTGGVTPSHTTKEGTGVIHPK